jgi:uncharacterized integral membrane protein
MTMQNAPTTTAVPRKRAEYGKRTGLVVTAIVLTIFIVLFVLNYQRWVSINLVFGSVQTRVVWALLIPFALGLLCGFISGRVKFRK